MNLNSPFPFKELLLVIKAVFISEQITECQLEQHFGSFITILYDYEKHSGLLALLERP